MKNKENFFKSKDHMNVFVLLYLDGKSRNVLLGINKQMYYSRKSALAWYNKIISHMNPPDISVEEFNGAKDILKELYDNMIEE